MNFEGRCMGFENRVLKVVAPELVTNGTASFFNGTLFIENITENQAIAVRQRLEDYEGITCNIEVNRIGQTSEYAYDFF